MDRIRNAIKSTLGEVWFSNIQITRTVIWIQELQSNVILEASDLNAQVPII